MSLSRFRPLLALCLAAACSSPAPRKSVVQADCRRLYVFWPSPLRNHTSLLIRKSDFPLVGAFDAKPGPDGERLLAGEKGGNPIMKTDWVEVGYGSAEYFERGRISVWSVLFRAPGTVLVRPFPWGGDPTEWRSADTAFWPVDLPPDDYKALLDYVSDSITRNADGTLSVLKRDGGESFYRSPLEYSFRRFCHSWVLTGLKRAGLDTTPWTTEQSRVVDWFEHWYRAPEACRPRA